MSDWIPASQKGPKRRQLCDFLYPGSQEEIRVWMLCSVPAWEAEAYYGDWSHWRPAEPLPSGASEWEMEDESDLRTVKDSPWYRP